LFKQLVHGQLLLTAHEPTQRVISNLPKHIQRRVANRKDHKSNMSTQGNRVFKTWIDGNEKTWILKDVIHVPKLNKNMFSISRGVLKRINILHTRGHCWLLVENEVVVKGIKECGIYRLFMTIKPWSYCNSHNAFSTSVVGVPSKNDNTQSFDVWHKRLDYVHHNMIKHMEAKDMVDRLVTNGSGENPPFV
jgi:hypothetical protein